MNEARRVLSGCNAGQIAAALGLKPYQGRQLFEWIHRRGVFDFDAMTDLAKPLRETLKNSSSVLGLRVARRFSSPNSGALKLLFECADGETVESVLLKDGERVTLCLSSQAGCPLRCSFCATGAAGFRRNLSVGEITDQALLLLSEAGIGRETSANIVYMGMGEPFLNYETVMESIRLLMDERGLNMGARRITVSTVGEIEGIRRFSEEDWQVRLSISLHAANDTLRSRLVPSNERHGLAAIKEAVRDYARRTGRQVTFEWTLLDGVNDRTEDAKELLAFLAGLDAFVNLIPWNAVPGLPFKPSPRTKCEAFKKVLIQGGVRATLRRENGGDIEAACGQLRALHAENAGP